jgi:hypothetical protein
LNRSQSGLPRVVCRSRLKALADREQLPFAEGLAEQGDARRQAAFR